jgi:hypothetical protein
MKRAPFLVFFVAAFLAFIVVPIVGIVVVELKAERSRERREIEAAARLKLLAEQQRLREAGAWLASAPPRKTEPTKPTGR